MEFLRSTAGEAIVRKRQEKRWCNWGALRWVEVRAVRSFAPAPAAGSDPAGFSAVQKGKAATLVMRQQTTPARESFHVATCTVAALGAITVFAVPTPPTSRKAGQLLGCPASRPAGANHPVYFGLAKVLSSPTLSTVDGRHTIGGALNVKTQDRCKREIFPGAAKMSLSVVKCGG
jgi:hypothetical protein